MTLEELGWTARESEAFAALAAPDLRPGRVAVAYGATFRVYLEGDEVLADTAGRLRHAATGRRDLPAVGDWVGVRWSGAPADRATIQAILPRRSLFSRKAAGTDTSEQVLAANVDTAFLVAGLDNDYNLRRLERYLAMTFESGARPVVILNKADLVPDADGFRRDAAAVAPGVPVHAVSSKYGAGVPELEPYLAPGQTIALLGSSGVGKSTLINRLLGTERQKTAEVRERDQRGRHTTSHRELVALPSGALLIDTPGMRELQLWSAEEGLQETFDDIQALGEGCHFADCRHDSEPRCAVKAAVAEGRLDANRLASFHKLQRELAQLAERQDVLLQQERRKRDRSLHKAARARLKEKGAK